MGAGIIQSIHLKRIRRRAKNALERGQWDEARAAAEELLDHLPADHNTYMLLGLAQIKSGDHAGALRSYQQAVKLRGKNLTAWRNLLIAASKAGDLEWAIQALEALVRFEPREEAHATRLKELYFRTGRVGKALELCKKHGFAATDSGLLVRAINQAIGAKKFAKGLSLAKVMARLDSSNPKGWISMGVCHFQRGETDQAGPCFKKALKLDPQNMVALNNLALVHLKKQEWQEAAAILERITRRESTQDYQDQGVDMAAILSSLGRCYEHQQQLKRAKKTYEKVLSVDAGSHQAQRKLDELELPLAAKRNQPQFLAAKRERPAAQQQSPQCNTCGANVEAGSTSCPECGAVFGPSRPCSGCSATLPADAQFCSHCGQEQSQRGRTCLRCGADNPSDVQYCCDCGAFIVLPEHFAAENAEVFESVIQSVLVQRVQDATDRVNALLAAEPGSPYALLAASMVHESASRPEKALEACTEAADVADDAEVAGAALERAGMIRMFYFQQHEQALADLERVLRRQPSRTHALYLIGLAHARLGQIDEALQAYRQLADDPNYELLALAATSEMFATHSRPEKAMHYCNALLRQSSLPPPSPAVEAAG